MALEGIIAIGFLLMLSIVFTIFLFFCWLVIALFALYLLNGKKEQIEVKRKLDLLYGIMDGKK